MTNESVVQTRVASRKDLEKLLTWAGDEGWNPGTGDALLFHSTDSAGFLVSSIDEELVAGVSLVRHTAEQAFLGLYLCVPKYRGKGMGLAIWNQALALVDGHTIGLDGVVDQQDNYRRSGFVYRFGNRRYLGSLNVADEQSVSDTTGSAVVTPATEADSGDITVYDASIGGFERSEFYRAWMQNDGSRHTFIARQGDLIVGVVGVRQCQVDYKVGPWLADSPNIALQLLQAASRVTRNQNVMIDIPDVNNTALDIASSLQLQPMFDTARMYKGEAPQIDERRLFGVATLELG